MKYFAFNDTDWDQPNEFFKISNGVCYNVNKRGSHREAYIGRNLVLTKGNKYHFIFKILKYTAKQQMLSNDFKVGIAKMKNDQDMYPGFDDGNFYAFVLKGLLTKGTYKNFLTMEVITYGDECYSGDIIEMIVDLSSNDHKDWRLSYHINGVNHGIGYAHLTDCDYRAGFECQQHGDGIKLIYFQQYTGFKDKLDVNKSHDVDDDEINEDYVTDWTIDITEILIYGYIRFELNQQKATIIDDICELIYSFYNYKYWDIVTTDDVFKISDFGHYAYNDDGYLIQNDEIEGYMQFMGADDDDVDDDFDDYDNGKGGEYFTAISSDFAKVNGKKIWIIKMENRTNKSAFVKIGIINQKVKNKERSKWDETGSNGVYDNYYQIWVHNEMRVVVFIGIDLTKEQNKYHKYGYLIFHPQNLEHLGNQHTIYYGSSDKFYDKIDPNNNYNLMIETNGKICIGSMPVIDQHYDTMDEVIQEYRLR